MPNDPIVIVSAARTPGFGFGRATRLTSRACAMLASAETTHCLANY
jgi:hypothetical protein